MNRIFTISDFSIDLDNIKALRTESGRNLDDEYLIIEMLKGNEYIINPETGETEILKPQLKIYFPNIDYSQRVKSSIEKEWSNYLNWRDNLPAANKN